MDIKPGKCPNVVNPRGHGKLSVALVGTDVFDVTLVDTESLVLRRADGVGGSVAPLSGPPGPRIRVKDVATPFEGLECQCHDLDKDRIDDVDLKFHISELVDALELGTVPPGESVTLVLAGALLDGPLFEAVDCIVIRGKLADAHELDDADEPLIERSDVFEPRFP
jgi:hypothetical protein